MGNILGYETKVVAVCAGSLILTNMWLTPMLASSEMGSLLQYFVQAWLFLKARSMAMNFEMGHNSYSGSGSGIGPVI